MTRKTTSRPITSKGHEKVLEKVRKINPGKGPSGPISIGSDATGASGVIKPSVHAKSESGEVRSFPIKGKNKDFTANVRKAESRAASFLEGTNK